MKRAVWFLALVLSGCTGALNGGVINVPPIVSPTRYPTACIVTDEWERPVAGAVCSSEGQNVTTDATGYALLPDGIEAGERIMVATAEGYHPGSTPYVVTADPDRNGNIPVVIVGEHVNPAIYSFDQLAAIRGAMWPLTEGACNNLSLGPRPGQPSNVIATVFLPDYPVAEQDCIIRELLRRNYTHVVVGPLVDSDGYHGMWAPNDWRGANFERFLDLLQKLWDAGLMPVVFLKPDNWSLDRMKTEFTPLLSQPRARNLIRITVPMGWEAGAAYEYSSCTWAAAGEWVRHLLPNALTLVHMVADRDAPAGTDFLCNDDDKHWNPGGNAAAWGRVAPFYHGWLAQFGAFDDPNRTGCDREHPSKTNFQCFQDSFNPEVRGSYRSRFERGYAGWPGVSAWRDRPLYVYAGEYAAYWKFWHGRTEAESVQWGDAAMRAGAAGYLDSGSVPARSR